MKLLSTGVDGSNLIEMAPACEFHPASVDWRGPFFLFLRRGSGQRWIDELVAGPMTEIESAAKKKELRSGTRVKYWNYSIENYV